MVNVRSRAIEPVKFGVQCDLRKCSAFFHCFYFHCSRK